jgi:N-acetylglucosamine kinase-like BadF-type ATPase
MSEQFVLGIDGGGSKTLAAVADAEGRLAGIARGTGVNPVDNPHWRGELDAAVARLAFDPMTVAAVTAALPAYGEVAALSRAQESAIAELFGTTRTSILNDVDGAQFGAFAGGPGILILSGSGSMIWARDATGASLRVGGWGEAIGDEGSAYWIGKRAIALTSQDLDGRAEAPALTRALFDRLGLDLANAQDSLTGWVAELSHPRSAVAALAELVSVLAEAGDDAALTIMEEAANELARHIATAERKLPGGRELPWSYAGGTFKSGLLLAALERRVGRPPLPPRLPPIGGALLHAARQAGWTADDAWIDRLAASIAENTVFNRTTTNQTYSTKQGEQGDAWKGSIDDDSVGEPRGRRTGAG